MSRKGRPPKQGVERYPNGRAKAEKIQPNDRVKRARDILGAAFSADVNDPFDVVHGMGWVTDAEHRIGRRYAVLSRRISVFRTTMKSTTAQFECERSEIDNTPIGNMTDQERVEIWDRVFNDDRPLEEVADEENMAAWRRLDGAMTTLERNQVRLVCVEGSWPQWAIQRLHGEILRESFAKNALAERRAQTDAEIAKVAACFTSSWESKRDLLINGLRQMIRAVTPDAQVRTRQYGELSAPVPKVADVEHRVTEDGDLALEVVKFRRA